MRRGGYHLQKQELFTFISMLSCGLCCLVDKRRMCVATSSWHACVRRSSFFPFFFVEAQEVSVDRGAVCLSNHHSVDYSDFLSSGAIGVSSLRQCVLSKQNHVCCFMLCKIVRCFWTKERVQLDSYLCSRTLSPSNLSTNIEVLFWVFVLLNPL